MDLAKDWRTSAEGGTASGGAMDTNTSGFPTVARTLATSQVDDFPGTIHVTEIELDNTLHYHKRLTETYYFLQCEPDAKMQLNDEVIDVHPGTCVMIRPGTRHRAIGRMKVLIVVYPKFDPADEWFD